MKRPFGNLWLIATLVAVGALLVRSHRPLRAQQPPNQNKPQPAKPDIPDGLRAGNEAHDVYLNDSFEAADALTRVKQLVGLGRWQEAAELLESTSKTEGKKLLRTPAGGYGSVRDHINDLIARWPAPGLHAYRNLVAETATNAFARAQARRDATELVGLFDRFFCTTVAAESAAMIGQLAIESGDFDLAAFVYRRVLRSHPDRNHYKSPYGAMLQIVRALGSDSTHTSLQGDSSEDEVTVRWFGHDRSVADVVKEVRTRFAQPKSVDESGNWPVFGGSYRRSSRSQCNVEEPGLLWRFRFRQPKTDDEQGVHIEFSGRSTRQASRDLTIFPVVEDGMVVVQRFREVVALHRNTGALAWRFSPDSLPAEPDNYLDDRPPGWDSVTIHRGRVYAALPREETSYYDFNPSRNSVELVCLDLYTGKLLWRSGKTSAGEFASELKFDSTPIVENGRLFIVGRRRRSFGFEDCYLYRFRASDGRLMGRVHLGSASTATFGSRTATSAIAAMNDGIVYVNSGLGTIVAVSVYTSNVKWLTLYERLRENDGGASGRASRDVRPWQFNPVIFADDKLYVLPTDSAALLVLDPTDGRTLAKIPVSELGGIDTLLGVDRGLVCGVGREVSCFNVATRSPAWSVPLPNNSKPFGRASWAKDHLLLPFRNHLARYATQDGSSDTSTWEVQSQGGNLLPLGDMLIVAGVSEVTAYVRKADIWRSLREAMAAAPNDPLPAIEMAEVAIGAGELDEALEVLDEAVRRFARATADSDLAVQTRLFNDVCKFAFVLVEHEKLDHKTLDRLHTYASRHAPDLRAGLRYRFEFAKLYERIGPSRRAVWLYHQVLRDRSLRELRAQSDGLSERSAAAVAADLIAALIAKHGRGVYAQLEEEAQRWLEGTHQSDHEGVFVRLIETFPNSLAAPKAMIAYGRWLVSAGRFDDAVKQLTLAYHRNTDRKNAPTLMREIADAHERAGSPEHAYRWLTKAMRDFPSLEFPHQGRRLTFKQYRRRLQHVRDRVVHVRPDLRLPLEHSVTLDLPESASLLSPTLGPQPGSSWKTLFLQTPLGPRAIDPRTGKNLWNAASRVPSDAELLLVRQDVVLLKTLYQVFALDPSTGKLLWTVGTTPPHVDDPGADWEDGGMLRSVAIDGDQLVIASDNGDMRRISIPEGTASWKRVVEDVPAGEVRITDPFIVYHLRSADRVKLCVLDAKTGNLIGSTVTQETRPVEKIFVTIDGRIVVVTSQSISLFDASTQKRRWRFASTGLIRSASLLLDLDAIYFSDNARTLCKLQLGDGTQQWCSDELVAYDDDFVVRQAGASLIVSTTADVVSVDSVNGMTLWRGTTPDHPELTARLMTANYLLVIDVSGHNRGEVNRAYFYDHRNASGLIPKRGGALDLGKFQDIRNVLATDQGLALQAGGKLHLFAHTPQDRR